MRISVKDQNGNDFLQEVDQFPDVCPVCGVGMSAKFVYASRLPDSYDTDYLNVVFKCPLNNCQRLFLGYYSQNKLHGSKFHLNRRGILFTQDKTEFPEAISKISTEFSKIYNQAEIAELNGLTEICGPGFRKALEFLIKDYLIHLDGDSKDAVTKAKLGDVIKGIDDSRIKECAKRAAWLGNDETHYYRKWESQDISSLKVLIKLTINWIENSEITKQYLEDMPDSKT